MAYDDITNDYFIVVYYAGLGRPGYIAYCPMDSERSGAGYKECAAQVLGVLQLARRPNTTLGHAHSSHKSFGS
jgi:hypothetical protein